MNDLDLTGERANAPGLTKAALKAERKAKSKAAWAARRAAFSAFFKSLGAKLPKIILLALAAGIVIAATIFDWFMSSRGWLDILPSLNVFAQVGAAASVGFWYYGVYRAREEFRQKDMVEGGVWSAIALAGYIICISGVVIATATNTSQAKLAAEASRKELAGLQLERDKLVDALEIYSVDYWTFAKDRDARTLNSQVRMAKGSFDMNDLDPDGACAGKLSFNQRRLCAQANGGVDEFTGEKLIGLRSEIQQDENGLKKAGQQTAELEKLQDRIGKFQVETGDKTARALGMYLKSEDAGNQALLGVFMLLSGLFLFCGGFFGDWFWRRLLPAGISAKKG